MSIRKISYSLTKKHHENFAKHFTQNCRKRNCGWEECLGLQQQIFASEGLTQKDLLRSYKEEVIVVVGGGARFTDWGIIVT
jgi:hypothetical protein